MLRKYRSAFDSPMQNLRPYRTQICEILWIRLYRKFDSQRYIHETHVGKPLAPTMGAMPLTEFVECIAIVSLATQH